MIFLQAHTPFPAAEHALGPDSEAPGLLAVGGELSIDRLTSAYAQGIFPWYSQGQPILWWSTDPRMVLYAREFKLSRSLKKTIKSGRFSLTMDQAFPAVIKACAQTPRPGQNGTWILPEMVQAYMALHHAGFAHSVEAWLGSELVGGLYGVSLGTMFYGESMFAWATDASKVALAALMAFARRNGIEMIDCQQATAHLETLGGRTLPRAEFLQHVHRATQAPSIVDWTFSPLYWDALGISA